MSYLFRYLPGCRRRPAAYCSLVGLLAWLLPAAVAAQAPTITTLSPGSGPLGTTVTVAGSNLGGVTSVLVGGVPATFAPGSAAQLTFTVPRQALSQRVRVSSAGGTGLSAAAFQVTRPSVSTVFPAQGNLGTTALGAGKFAAPTVTDVDGDGRRDLLVGNHAGNVLRYEQTAANGTVFALVGNITTDGTTNLNVGLYAAPVVTDVDGDGRRDLLVGTIDGNVLRYEQTAANGSIFAPVGDLTTDGSTALDAATYSTSAVTDLDGDGRLDLLVGNRTGNVLRYEQPAAGSATFAALLPLATNGISDLNVDYETSPTVTDVDGDGLLDLLVGNLRGNVLRYEQTTANSTTFVLLGYVTTDGASPIWVVNYAAPTVTDVDGDGLLDLLVGGTSGAVQRFEQTTAGGAIFALLGNLTTDGSTNVYAGRHASPTVTDVDGDGLLDLLVGGEVGYVGRFEQTTAGGSIFASLGYVTTDGSTRLTVGAEAAPAVADLDSNGLLDLLVGNEAGLVQRYEQTAAGGGTFALVGSLTTDGSTALDAGADASPTVTDLNGDGVLDLLVGNGDGLMPSYEQTPPPALTGLSPGNGPLGTTLILTGTDLTGLTSVLVGGVPAASFAVQSATRATAVVPRQAVNQRVRASNAVGTSLSAATFQVTRPSPSAVLPALGTLTTDGSTALYAGSYVAPAITDLDGDGLLDLLAGNNPGNVLRYEQTAANGGTFAPVGSLTTDGTTALDASDYAVPTVTDVDGDGLLDLLVGSNGGTVQRYEQTAANGGVFALVGNLTTNGSTALDVGLYAAPTVTDLDGDGLLDLLVGNLNGNVQRYEQTAAGGGVFASQGSLTTNGSTLLDAGSSVALAVTDVDGDGLLDLLAGNEAGNVQRFEQVPVPTVTALDVAAELPGQEVTLTGTGFVAGSTVRFGGVAAASVSYTSATSLTAVVPVGATPGSSAVTVGSYDVASPAAGSPAFEVLQVYRSTAASACLSTTGLTVSGTGGAGVWRYLRLAGTGGAVVAAIEDTRNLGTVTARVLALGTGTSQPVRQDGRGRRYLDRNFTLATSTALGTGNSVRVRFFGLSSELSRLTAADPAATAANLKLSQYDGPNEDCDLSNNGTPTDNRLLAAPATTLSGADWFTAEATVTNHFSEFYLTGASTPLPVQLVAFTAQPTGPAAVQLAWTTASELNSAAFEVERSPDGMTYTTVGTVAAAGNSSAPRRYRLLDRQLPGGDDLLYYRLKQVDADGTFSYSPVRTVRASSPAGLALFPNPTTQAATLTGAAPGTVVTVVDALGRPVLTATADASGTAALPLPHGLASGVYVVRVGSQVLRLVVE